MYLKLHIVGVLLSRHPYFTFSDVFHRVLICLTSTLVSTPGRTRASSRCAFRAMRGGMGIRLSAMRAAYIDTVRRHRQANVPMVMWEDGRTVLVSPFDVWLPGKEDRPAAE